MNLPVCIQTYGREWEFNDLGVGNTMKAAAKINNATLTHLEALVNLLSILLSSKLSIAERVDEK